MSLQPGNEFKIVATPTPELQRKLAYLAAVDNDSVLTGHAGTRGNSAASARKTASNEGAVEMVQMLEQQRIRQQQIQDINDRLDALDQASDEAVRKAQEHLDEIMRTANRTRDGRIVFQDEDGTIYDEQGNAVDEDDVDWTSWNADGPSWKDFGDAVQTVVDVTAVKQEVDDLQDRAREDLDDEELAALGDDLSALEDQLETFGGADLSPTAKPTSYTGRPTSAAKAYDGDAVMAGNVGGVFLSAVVPPDPPLPDRNTVEPAPVVPPSPPVSR